MEKKYPYSKIFTSTVLSPVRTTCLHAVRALTKLMEDMNN